MVKKVALVPDNFQDICQKLYDERRIPDLISMGNTSKIANEMCQPFIKKYFSEKVCVCLVEYENEPNTSIKYLSSNNYRCTVKTMHSVIKRIFDVLIQRMREYEADGVAETEDVDEVVRTRDRVLKLIKQEIEKGNYLLDEVDFGLEKDFPPDVWDYRAFPSENIIVSNDVILGYVLLVKPVRTDEVGEYVYVQYFEH